MDFLKEFYLEALVPVCAFVGVCAFWNGEKLRKRINFMQGILIRNGVVGWKDFTIDLCDETTWQNFKHGRRIHDKTGDYDTEDFYLSKLRRRVSELEETIAEMKGEKDDNSNRNT